MKVLSKMVRDSDVLIYNMDECCPDELEFIIKVLKYSDFDSPKILILISSVLTWSKNNVKPQSSGENEVYDDSKSNLRTAYAQYDILV